MKSNRHKGTLVLTLEVNVDVSIEARNEDELTMREEEAAMTVRRCILGALRDPTGRCDTLHVEIRGARLEKMARELVLQHDSTAPDRDDLDEGPVRGGEADPLDGYRDLFDDWLD